MKGRSYASEVKQQQKTPIELTLPDEKLYVVKLFSQIILKKCSYNTYMLCGNARLLSSECTSTIFYHRLPDE